LQIRQAGILDLDRLVLLFDGYRIFYGQESDRDRARAFLEDRFRQQESVVLIALSGDQAIGFTQLYPSFSSVSTAPIFILNDLFVAPEARGKGAGRALLAAAADHARSVGAVRLTLSTAFDNLTAQALYEAAGWIRESKFIS
jgi:GNAT superfamily N-acetyltransferase